MPTPILFLITLVAGALLWTLGEYLLHRFAMHELHGKGILSREHLEHHVKSQWAFDTLLLAAWTGVLITGALLWGPVGWLATGSVVGGIGLAAGWVVGYFHYEYQHAMSHRRGPSGRYTAFVRRHHFHHHFGHPLANHGVTLAFWDKVFGTYEAPDVIRVPRRLAMPWLLADDGTLRPELADDYVLVGSERADERQEAIDRARAFASVAPTA